MDYSYARPRIFKVDIRQRIDIPCKGATLYHQVYVRLQRGKTYLRTLPMIVGFNRDF